MTKADPLVTTKPDATAFVPLDDPNLEHATAAELRRAYRELREHHSRLVKQSLARLKTEGSRYSGEEPYGYVRIDGELVEHEKEQRVIRIVRELHETNPTWTYRAIARELARRRLKTRRRTWFEHVQVKRILERPPEPRECLIGTDGASVPDRSGT
jgi:hypothetical protein